MSADENQTICLDDDEVEEVNQDEMETTAPEEQGENGTAVEGEEEEETPMEDSNAVDGEKKEKEEEKKEEEEDDNTLNLRRPYPNLLTIHKLKLEDIKVAVSELSEYWDDTCLNIRYIRGNTVGKGFMRMKFPTEEAAEIVFKKLQPMEINGKPFVYEPPTEGNKKDYSLYVNNIPQGVTVKEVQALFPQARNVVIPLNEEDQNQGYAIVECNSLQEAETIMSESKELKLKDNALSIDLISHNSKDEDGKNKKHQNNQQNKKGRFSNQNNRRNQQVNKKGGKPDQRGRRGMNSSNDMRGKRQQQMQQMQPRKQRWSPDDRRQQGRKPGQYMHKGRMDGGGRRQLMDGVGGGQWNQQSGGAGGGQNVTQALSQTSELLKGLTSLLGQQMMNPNQMGGQGDGQYGNQSSWGQGMDHGNNYGSGYQNNSSGGSRGYSDNMNYGNYDYNKPKEISSSPSVSARYSSGDSFASRKRPVDQQSGGGRYGNKKMQRRSNEYNSSGGNYGGSSNWGSSYRGNY